jgi:hypothetical protein
LGLSKAQLDDAIEKHLVQWREGLGTRLRRNPDGHE